MWVAILELALRVLDWLLTPKTDNRLNAANQKAAEERAAEVDAQIANARDADDAARLLNEATRRPK